MGREYISCLNNLKKNHTFKNSAVFFYYFDDIFLVTFPSVSPLQVVFSFYHQSGENPAVWGSDFLPFFPFLFVCLFDRYMLYKFIFTY